MVSLGSFSTYHDQNQADESYRLLIRITYRYNSDADTGNLNDFVMIRCGWTTSYQKLTGPILYPTYSTYFTIVNISDETGYIEYCPT